MLGSIYLFCPKYLDTVTISVISQNLENSISHIIMLVEFLKKIRKEEVNANSADPDQTAPEEQSDLGLHWLPKFFCLHTCYKYCIQILMELPIN